MKRLFKLFALVLLLHSCITKETDVTVNTVIINNSGYEVTYIAFGEISNERKVVLNIENGEQAIRIKSDIGEVNPFPLDADSVYIIFAERKQLKYKFSWEADPIPDDDRNPYSENAYEKESVGKHRRKYTYTITEEDYNNALPIEPADE
ncbi:MAG: hypothetical protein ACK5JS_08085 [Mangrovibacterium sp.]